MCLAFRSRHFLLLLCHYAELPVHFRRLLHVNLSRIICLGPRSALDLRLFVMTRKNRPGGLGNFKD